MGKGFLAEGTALQRLGDQKFRRDPRCGGCREWWDRQMGDPVKPGIGHVVSAERKFGVQVIDNLGEG